MSTLETFAAAGGRLLLVRLDFPDLDFESVFGDVGDVDGAILGLFTVPFILGAYECSE